VYRGKSIGVVVPAFNEEVLIRRVVETIPDTVDRIIIVDDASTDGTAEVVRGLRAARPRIELISHEQNQGVGGAIATGYKWVRDHDIDIAVVMAGDAQMDPSDMPALLDPVVDDLADYSKGNRLITGEAFRKIPKVRYFGNAALSLLTKIASGYWHVADSQTGYTAINHRALKAIEWDEMFKRYGQPNDLLVRLNVAEMRVIDVPVRPVYNIGERSGIKIRKVLFTIGWLLVKRFFWRLKEKYVIRNFHPLVFFYLFGFAMVTFSALMFVRFVYIWAQTGNAPELTLISWLFSFGIGFNSIGFAMWFDYDENKHLAVWSSSGSRKR
jgi:glycosyltransferase involved in cell wall biosynthesis